MKLSDLIFIGIKGSVVALNRATGETLWATHLKGSDFVNVVVQQNRILATCYGEVFCLDAFTGEAIWHNRLKGMGMGLATIAMENSPSTGQLPPMAEHRVRQQRAAAAAS